MGFPIDERNRLLTAKGVGPTVIARLEQIGIVTLSQLAREDAASVTRQIVQMMRASCWHNSPQARAAITAAIALARDGAAEQS
jgi:predicted flap endonuclease-1-like 5' DNA nuclease